MRGLILTGALVVAVGVGAGVVTTGGGVVVTLRGTAPNLATGAPTEPGRHILSTPVSESWPWA